MHGAPSDNRWKSNKLLGQLPEQFHCNSARDARTTFARVARRRTRAGMTSRCFNACPREQKPRQIGRGFSTRTLPLPIQTLQTTTQRKRQRLAITVVHICGAQRGTRYRRANYERQASLRSATGWSSSSRRNGRTSAPRPACMGRARPYRSHWRGPKAQAMARSIGMRKLLSSSSIVPRDFLGEAD